MESATVRRPPPLPGLLQLGLVGALIALAAVAWVLTDDRMSGMDAGPGTDPGTLGFFVGVWIVMMAAMMFPSIAPMVVMYARVQEGRRRRGQTSPAGATAIFVGGYLVSWAAAGLAGYGLFELGAAVSGDAFAWSNSGPYLAGAVIAAAAVYQLTPLKDVCLRKCRTPLMFLLTAWRPGRAGALRMGAEHGAWCIGCCWMLMAALFALGVMSLGWMAFIAALIAVEKLLPWRALANRGIALVLLALAIGVALSAEDVPGLTLPDSPQARRAMDAMGMEPGSSGEDAMGGRHEQQVAPGSSKGDATGGHRRQPMSSMPGEGMDER